MINEREIDQPTTRSVGFTGHVKNSVGYKEDSLIKKTCFKRNRS